MIKAALLTAVVAAAAVLPGVFYDIATIFYPALGSASVAGAASPTQQPEPFRSANLCVETLLAEGDFDTGLWPELIISYNKQTDPRVRDARRLEILNRLIELHKTRLAALERMRRLEAGR